MNENKLSPELERKVVDYIKAAYEKGYSKEKIRKTLLEKKYPKRIADKLINKYAAKEKKAPAKKYAIKIKKTQISILPMVLILLVVLAVVVGVIFFFPKTIKCADQTCFIEAADNCEAAYFEQLEEGSLFSYTVKNCVLTKTAVRLSEDEPAEMKELFEGKSMNCEFSMGNFNSDLLTTLTIGIEECEGPLRNAIEQILAVV